MFKAISFHNYWVKLCTFLKIILLYNHAAVVLLVKHQKAVSYIKIMSVICIPFYSFLSLY